MQSPFNLLLLLPITPNSSHRLRIVRGIPVRIEHDESIGSDHIQSAPSRLTAQHENKLILIRLVVELVYNFHPLLDGHRPVQSSVAVPS